MTDGPTWDGSSRPRARPDVEAVAVDGELVLWDPDLDTVHRLDPVGSLIWPFLDGDATIAELAADVADIWDLPADQAERSLIALAEQLQQARLLVLRRPEANR